MQTFVGKRAPVPPVPPVPRTQFRQPDAELLPGRPLDPTQMQAPPPPGCASYLALFVPFFFRALCSPDDLGGGFLFNLARTAKPIPVVRSAGSAVVSGSSRLTAFCIPPVFVRRRAATVGGTASVIGCVATRRSPRRRRRRRCERSSSRTRMTMMIRSRAPPPGSDGVEPFMCRRRPWRRWPLVPPARLRCWLDFLRSRSRPPPCAPLAFLRSRLWLRCPPCLPSTLDRSFRGPHRVPLLRRRRRRRVRKAARLPLLLSTTHRSCLL